MGFDRKKNAAEWFYGTVYREEKIAPRPVRPTQPLPKLLRAARSLENRPDHLWQSRESVFLKQAKLLQEYEDDFSFSANVVRYFPTYEALTDQELRGYFTWRTRLRRGEMVRTSLSFVFLHIYELLNQIGVDSPQEGYRQLMRLRQQYGALDESIISYLDRWTVHYVVYYGLDQGLLEELPRIQYDRSISVLDSIENYSTDEIMEAVKILSPKWLSRSKFYGAEKDLMDEAVARVLRRTVRHYDGCKKGFAEQFFGPLGTYEVRLFDTAVFCDPMGRRIYEYKLDERCVYRCRNGHWTVTQHGLPPKPNAKLGDILKTVDALLREAADFGHPIRAELQTKWLMKIIREETDGIIAQRKAAEEKKLKLDLSQLDRIRRDAALTQEKLTVEEEAYLPEEEAYYSPEEEPEELLPLFPGEEVGISLPQAAAEPTEAAGDCPLEGPQYRLLRDLLYGGDLGWIRAEGYMMSVLLDGINDTLYDIFQDTVVEEGPCLVEDYIDELKEMVSP